MVNTLHKMGATRHECMVLELVLLGKTFASIQNILLFNDKMFAPIVETLITKLQNHDKNVKLFKKLKGT